MIRAFTATDGVRHTLELDVCLVDGLECIEINADGNNTLRFETVQGTITCALESFWHEIAGPALTAGEAALLLAECLARQIVLTRQETTLRDLTRLLAQGHEVTAPSLAWLTTRLDPWSRQAMTAYDGSEAMTKAISRIVKQSPATIHTWAHQLGLAVPPTQSEEAATVPGEVVTGPLETLAPVVSESAEADAKHPFLWTPERLQQLEEALATCIGTTVIERARQIADKHDWPAMSVRSKLYAIQKPHRDGKPTAREAEHSEAEQEGDRHAECLEAAPV
jgi:hypothetical protein